MGRRSRVLRESKGSYTCYRAGEHTDSFYSWQGFMDGACLSGIAAADEILVDLRHGRL